MELLGQIRRAISDTVSEDRIGVAFSGGVDSTLISRICSDMGHDVVLLTVGFAGSHDVSFAGQVGRILNLEHHTLEIEPDGFAGVASAVQGRIGTENLSWNENCIAFYYVSSLASRLGLGTVVTANGIDELFCGYDAYRRAYCEGAEGLARIMEEKLQNELGMFRAVDLVSSGFGVRVLQPLLSERFVEFARGVPLPEKIRGPDDLLRKHAIRGLAREIGVPEISYAKRKKALQYGSRIHKELQRSRKSR